LGKLSLKKTPQGILKTSFSPSPSPLRERDKEVFLKFLLPGVFRKVTPRFKAALLQIQKTGLTVSADTRLCGKR
jgi:hypothetical protein